MSNIYGLYDVDGNLRYIGKGNDPAKRLKSHMRDSRYRKTPVYAWIRKHGQPRMEVLEAKCDDWKEAERRLIAEARARGEKLLNVADGGDMPHSPSEVRKANAKVGAAKRDPIVWRFNRDFAQGLRDGLLTERTKELLRELAALKPKEYGMWAKV